MDAMDPSSLFHKVGDESSAVFMIGGVYLAEKTGTDKTS